MIKLNKVDEIKNSTEILDLINSNITIQPDPEIVILKTYLNNKKFNFNKLKNEILEAEIVDKLSNVCGDFLNIYVYGKEILDEEILDDIINNHEYITLAELKELKIKEVDQKTTDIINEGFEFDNKTFSLSMAAQSNWTNIKSNKNVFVAMSLFPIQISTLDSDLYFLQDTDVDTFWASGLNKVKYAYSTGGSIKKLIKDALTKIDLEQIIDNR